MTSNSQCASMTSRPLFIIVAESMVILRPIFQVGCLSAWSGLTRSSSSRVKRRNGPPDAVRISRRISLPLTAVQALMHRVVLAVDRKDRHASAARCVRHERARHHEYFLVGDGDRFSGVDGGEHRLESGRTGRRANDDVGFGTASRPP